MLDMATNTCIMEQYINYVEVTYERLYRKTCRTM